MPSKIVLAGIGLSTSPNYLTNKDGSLNIALNTIIRRDNLVEPRRGFTFYGETLSDQTKRCTEIFSYKSRLLRHYGTTLDFQNGVNNDGTVNFDSFNGSYSQTSTGLRIKSISANSNFYFTTSEGVKKISAMTADQLSTSSGFITQAGGIKALDVTASLDITDGSISGFLPSDNAVAYRIVWGIKDLNNNLVLGSPSQRVEVYNNLSNLDIRDFNNILSALDNINQSGSLITDGNYVSTLVLGPTASASELRNNIVALASKIDTDILYANDTGSGAPLNISAASVTNGIVTITFSSGNALDYFTTGSNIYVTGFQSNSVDVLSLNKAQVITGVTSTTITFAPVGFVTVSSPIGLNGQISAVTVNNPAIVTCNNHGLTTGQKITISGTTTTPSINGDQVVTVLSDNTFSVPVNVTVVTNAQGTWNIKVDTITSAKINSYEYRTIVNSVIAPALEPFTTFTIPSPASNDALLAIQNALDQIINRLNNEPIAVISSVLSNAYITSLSVTQTANVNLHITVPEDVTLSNFYQVYRSRNFPATGPTSLVDVFPDDELKLAYEAFPTSAELSAREIDILDITPEGFLGANLYTNPSTGEGIAAANDLPPFAKDINLFKNVVFYANTKTRHGKIINLLGVQNMIDEYNGGTTPKLVISDGTQTISLKFVTGLQEITDVTFTAESTFTGGTRRYFDIYSASDATAYRVVFQSPTMTVDPSLTGKTPIRVILAGGETASQVSSKVRDKINVVQYDFTAVDNTPPKIRITNTDFGATTNASLGTLPGGSVITIIQQGRGEDVATKQVLLSTDVSPSKAVDQTARSIVRIINKETTSPVNAFYISGAQDVPGQMFFEAKELNTNAFAIIANDSITGASFNPDISPELIMSSISNANPTVITTSTSHGILNGNKVIVVSDSIAAVNGVFTATVTGTTTFTVPANGNPGDSSAPVGGVTLYEDAVLSENSEKANRVYYSKYQQPEAVPIVNYLTVGAEDKEILRIFPLRDSLFVFKQDGLFRISGETAPFVVQLFDSSCIMIAPDSLGIANNFIYSWTTQGISTVSESGVNIISRQIDDQILKLQSYPNFTTATHGTGYESDNEYIVWTTARPIDTTGTIGYRYNNLTQSWNNLDRDCVSAFVNPVDNKLYLGSSDVAYIERERKDFDRTDYADREYDLTLGNNKYVGDLLYLQPLTNVAIGDVIYQNQTLSIVDYNQLLEKLDIEPQIGYTNYFSTLQAINGDNLRLKIIALANKLDTDTGVADSTYFSTIDGKTGSITSNSVANPTVITSTAHGLKTGRFVSISGVASSLPSINGNYEVTVLSPNTFSIPVAVTTAGTGGSFTTVTDNFIDIVACFNAITAKLNTNPNLFFTNYSTITNNTEYEAIITAVDNIQKTITINNAVAFVAGPMIVYKAIKSAMGYSPITLGDDPLSYKQLREATLMFDGKAFTKAKMSFASDLLPEFIDVSFNSDGNGIFGYSGIYPLPSVGFGGGFFGGAANSAPFRTYIPRQCQRCRYLFVVFAHETARESYKIIGTTVTGEVSSTRAYR